MGDLRGLARSLRALTKVPSQVSAPFAEWITSELKANILTGVDPYGHVLAANRPATIRKKGHGRPLQDSLTLLGEVKAVPLAGAGVGLDAGPSYGRFQFPTRPYLPVNVLPAKWRAELQRLLHEAGLRILK